MWTLVLIFEFTLVGANVGLASEKIPGFVTQNNCNKELVRQERIAKKKRYRLEGTCVKIN